MPATKQQLEFLGKLQKKSLKNWKCQCPGCKETAINSHLLQRHGVLDNASSSHRYREVKYRYPVYWFTEKDNYEFKSVGITEAISYPVFCKKHDSDLFHSIEIKKPDLDNYNNQLLYCFRTLCAEIRKFEIVLKQWAMIINPNEELGNGIDVMKVKDITSLFMSKGTFLRKFKDDMIKEMNHPKGLFCFKRFSYPKLDVYASAVIEDEEICLLPNGTRIKQTICFIHIIPLENSLEIIVGYPRNLVSVEQQNYSDSWGNLDQASLGLMLTDLFAKKVENFGMSEELYDSIPEATRMKFIEFVSQHGNDNISIDFNLFANS